MQASVKPSQRGGGDGGGGAKETASAPEGVDVIVEANRGAGRPAVNVTASIAAAALYPHDLSVEALSVGAVEAERHSAGDGGRAAAAVAASPTGTRAVPLCGRASGEGDPDWFLGAECSLTLLPLLDGSNRAAKMVSLHFHQETVQY